MKIANDNAGHISQEAAQHLRQATDRYFIFYSKLTPNVYTRVVESGVQLTIRYLCGVRNRRASEQMLWEEILRAMLPLRNLSPIHRQIKKNP